MFDIRECITEAKDNLQIVSVSKMIEGENWKIIIKRDRVKNIILKRLLTCVTTDNAKDCMLILEFILKCWN